MKKITTLLLFAATVFFAQRTHAQCDQIVTFTNNTLQSFTVPLGVTQITIAINGGNGGNFELRSPIPPGFNIINTFQGGKGASLLGTFDVTPGEELQIIVGGEGSKHHGLPDFGSGGGGGGASYVARGSSGFEDFTNPNLLIVAGGGGGASALSNGFNALVITTSNTGSGGAAGYVSARPSGGGATNLHNGGASPLGPDAGGTKATSGAQRGVSANLAWNFFAGGDYRVYGGFGGGGAGGDSGGGGGGFSGGWAGLLEKVPGGAGESKNNGTNQSFTQNFNEVGQVSILYSIDLTPPTITCTNDITIDNVPGECGYLPIIFGMPIATDNCTGPVTITNNIPIFYPVGSTIVTWTATDASGNTAVCEQVITVVDTEAPEWDIAPANLTVECDGTGNTTEFNNWLNNTFTGTDNCPNPLVTHNNAELSDDCGNTGSQTVTFTLTDINDNAIMADATFTIEDTTDPDWVDTPSDMTVECDGSGNTAELAAWLLNFSGDDACGSAAVTHNSVGLSDDCGATGAETVTFTLTDECGNDIEMDATFTIEDTTPAVIGCPGDVTAFTEAGDCGAIVNFQNAVALEECSDVFVYQTEGYGSGSVFPIGDTLIEFTAQDECGNLSTCEFTVTVVDDDAPDAVCQNITVQLDETGNATITANQINFGSTDNCGIDTMDIDISTFDCSNVGENEVALTVTDLNGNAATCIAIVTVEDVTAPEIVCNDITVELNADGTVTIDPMDIAAGSSDACGIASYELNIDTFGCLDVGNSTVILTIMDVNGNQSSCSSTVTIEDNTAPELVCMDVTLELNEDGVAYIIPSQLADANDPCDVLVLSADVDEVSCADIGIPVTVNIFANDGNGNSSFCSATVTVVDVLGPQIVCPENEQVNLDPIGAYTLGDYIGDGIATVSDNCTDPVTIFTQDPTPGTLLGLGIQEITFTAEDEYGNVSTCSFELDVEEILGANDTENFASLVLYPNPANNKVQLSNPRQIDLNDVTIYDLTGRMVNKVDLTNMGSEITIDVSTLANATYILVIKGSQGISNKQLIVNNL